MNRNHHVDRLFRHGLENYSLDAPEYLWRRIEAEWEQKTTKKNAVGYLLPLVLGISLLITTGLILFNYSQSKVPLLQKEPERASFPIGLEDQSQEQLPTDQLSNGHTTPPMVPPVQSPPPSSRAKESNLPLFKHQKTTEPVALLASRLSEEVVLDHPSLSTELAFDRKEIKSFTPLPDMAQTEVASQMARSPGDDVQCASFVDKSWKVYVDFMAGPDWVQRSLEAKDSEFDQYRANRANMEEIQNGFTAQIRLSSVSPSGIAVRSGLSYSQINEQFKTIHQEIAGSQIQIFRDPNGNITDIDTIFQYRDVAYQSNNRLTTIDIPLTVGYEAPVSGRLNWSVNAGVQFNMVFNQKGTFLAADNNTIVDFSSEGGDYPAFKNRLGVGFIGSASLGYELTPDWQILLEPQVRTYPHSVTSEDYALDQQYFTAGLQIGLRKRL